MAESSELERQAQRKKKNEIGAVARILIGNRSTSIDLSGSAELFFASDCECNFNADSRGPLNQAGRGEARGQDAVSCDDSRYCNGGI